MGIRLLKAKIIGYIGIAGLPSIEIDFTKCKNRVIVISGRNGVGKSRLLNAISSILPDGNDCLISTMEAGKQFQLSDGDNFYEINISHPLGSNNKRLTTKGYISKNGVELNPNGNITSYKEVVFSEFELDSSFLSLSRLSGDDRGLVDKRPSERRKFVSSILDSLDTYNEIYKALCKKNSIFRSYVNNLSNKIQNIGDENYLRTTLVSLDNRIMNLNKQIDGCKENLAKCDALLSINKIDENTREKYIELSKLMSDSEKEVTNKTNNRNDFYNTVIVKLYGDIENLNRDIAFVDNEIVSLQSQISDKTISSRELLGKITSLQDNISALDIKIQKKKTEIDPEIISTIISYESKLRDIEQEFSMIGIKDINNISSEELSYLMSLINKIVFDIDKFYEITPSDSLSVLEKLDFDSSKIISIINNLNIDLEDIENRKIEAINLLNEMKLDSKIISSLDKKPEDCNNNSCPFVSQAIQLLNTKYGSKDDYHSRINKIENDIDRLNDEIISIKNKIEKYELLLKSCNVLNDIIHVIDSNSTLLAKIRITHQIINNSFLKLISQGSNFNFLRDLNMINNVSNRLIEYKSDNKVLEKLKIKEEIQNNNTSIIKEYELELKEKNKELISITKEYEALIKDIEFISSLVDNKNKKKERLIRLKELNEDLDISIKENNNIKEEFNKLNLIFESYSDTLEEIPKLKQSIECLKNEIIPLQEQKKQIESQLIMLDNYRTDYELYKEKYDLVEKLQKYSSPGKGGIQELFLDLYMSKTLDLSNQLLGMIFGGKYKLLPYQIKDGEFKIPFLSNGFIVDDVSSGSRSQICMMGMIISLVMRNQSSTKFSITSLDEIDSGLDHDNRYLFVDVLYKIISILNIEQLFIVSHSIELSTSNVDVIQLTSDPEYDNMFTSANVIFKNI